MPLLLLPLLAALAWGADDRQAVARAIAEFAKTVRASAPPEIWSERTEPRLHVGNVRFPSPDIALVDAAWVTYGSVVLKLRTPVLLVLKKDAAGWRILDYRPCACPCLPGKNTEPTLFLRE